MPNFYQARCAGVYYLKNRRNGRLYIGSTDNMRARIQKHIYCLEHNNHPNAAMQDDFNNSDRFDYGILWVAPMVYGASMIERKDLRKKELELIDQYGSALSGYNSIRDSLRNWRVRDG